MPPHADPRPRSLTSATHFRARIEAADAAERTVLREFRRLIAAGVSPAAASKLARNPLARGAQQRRRRAA